MVFRIQLLNRTKAFFTVLHLDEPKTARSARKLVNNDFGRVYCPVSFEQALEVAFAGVE